MKKLILLTVLIFSLFSASALAAENIAQQGLQHGGRAGDIGRRIGRARAYGSQHRGLGLQQRPEAVADGLCAGCQLIAELGRNQPGIQTRQRQQAEGEN